MIDGVIVTPLKQIPDERGKVMHMLRNDDEHFEKFGEIYFSVVNPGAVKAWHCHREMTLNYSCVLGMIKLVLYDDRPDSHTRYDTDELFIGDDNYCLVVVPPFVWNGFKGISVLPSIVANCSTHPHSIAEIVRMPPNKHLYDWKIKHG